MEMEMEMEMVHARMDGNGGEGERGIWEGMGKSENARKKDAECDTGWVGNFP